MKRVPPSVQMQQVLTERLQTWFAEHPLRQFVARAADLSPEEHSQFVEPYRSMAREELTMVCARVLVRRR